MVDILLLRFSSISNSDTKSGGVGKKRIILKAANLNKILNLDSSPQKVNEFIKNGSKAQLKDSNSMDCFRGIDSPQVRVKDALIKV